MEGRRKSRDRNASLPGFRERKRILRRTTSLLILLLTAMTFLAACGRGTESAAPNNGEGPKAAPEAPAAPPPPAPEAAGAGHESGAGFIPAQAREKAEQIFASRCTPCHGANGMGNGPASSGLTPPPRNFHDKAWQASVSDDHIEKIIQYGGGAVGKSPAMPANPDLTSKPQVVAALMELIRRFGR